MLSKNTKKKLEINSLLETAEASLRVGLISEKDLENIKQEISKSQQTEAENEVSKSNNIDSSEEDKQNTVNDISNEDDKKDENDKKD